MGSVDRSRLSAGVTVAVALCLGLLALVAPSVSTASAAPARHGVVLAPQGGVADEAAPLPPNASHPALVFLPATSCSAPGACVAVGDYFAHAGFFGLIETLSDGTWTATEAPEPPNASTNQSVSLVAVSCSSTTFCVAVGSYVDPSFNHLGIIETDRDGSWSATEKPYPPGSSTLQLGGLVAVNCLPSSACTAVGSFVDGSNFNAGLVETLAAGVWTPTQAPVPPNGVGPSGFQNASLDAVGCASAASCTAVGDYVDPAVHDYGLIETLSGGTWSAAEAPQPGNAGTDATGQSTTLAAVSCPTLGWCEALGTYEDGHGFTFGLTETLAGGTWSPAEAPEPSNAGNESDGHEHVTAFPAGTLSCPASGSCAAVGTYEDDAGHSRGLVESLADGSWSASETAEPSGAGTGSEQAASLGAVSCSWPGACSTVGTYDDDTGAAQGLVETLAGGAASAVEAPLPSGTPAGAAPSVGAVSCVAAFCLAAGDFFAGSSAGQDGLLLTYEGPAQPGGGGGGGPGATGYDEVAADGGLFAFGAPYEGSMGGQPLVAPIVGMAVDTATGGYWEVAADGGLFAFDAPFEGSMGGKPLVGPVVGMAFDSLTGGYYEVAADGGLFAFDAPYFGSMGGQPLVAPIVGVAFDPTTGGYWEVAADGGLFAFDAPFEGSMGGQPLVAPVVGMAVDPATGGYWEVAADGGLFAFDAPFEGSMGAKPLVARVVGLAVDPLSGGYDEVAADGGLFAFGAPYEGSMGGQPLVAPIVGLGFV
ncbi:MAG TPA: hypothetical protein VK277_15110 [Acidimicrobiales bacterium]|nr:hypothetical protein [Acidimicrobiales bacterium]